MRDDRRGKHNIRRIGQSRCQNDPPAISGSTEKMDKGISFDGCLDCPRKSAIRQRTHKGGERAFYSAAACLPGKIGQRASATLPASVSP